jgi:hypothetical protein
VHSAIQVDRGEHVAITCSDPLEALVLGLPPITEADVSAVAA